MRLSVLPIANADLSAVLRVGDIHSGKEDCTEAYDRAVAAQWSAFKVPVVYTPGDNEWADCHKVSSIFSVPTTVGNGKVDPYESPPHGYNVPNFRRITAHGSTTPLEYLKLTIDPTANAENGTEAFGLFSWKRVNPL
jgi:hypothetical protein